MGKTFKDDDDYGRFAKQKFSERRRKKLRKIVTHNKQLEVPKEDKPEQKK